MARGEGSIDLEIVSHNQMEPVIAIDADGTVAFANRRFGEVFGLPEPSVAGEEYAVLSQILEEGFADLRDSVEAVLAGDAADVRVELSMVHPEDAPVPRRLPAEARVTPIYDGDVRLGAIVSFRRISKRKAYERQLERQNERLEEFAGMVAHDLRNPLNVAEGNLVIAREECDSSNLDTVAAALDRMWIIVEETLTLAKQGRHVGETEPVVLSELVSQCWGTVSTEGATLRVEDDATVLADPDRLRSLFENLFRNSIDHGLGDEEGGSEVTVRVGTLDDGFYVADDGPGIPEDRREEVFELGFSTAENGTGYGLAIVRWIAEAHGWSVEAVEHGEGARFEFTDVDFAA